MRFALYSDGGRVLILWQSQGSLRLWSAGRKPGGSPEGLPHIFRGAKRYRCAQ
jgi:hypothetical protein